MYIITNIYTNKGSLLVFQIKCYFGCQVCSKKQTKKTDLFQNEPKQTENGLNFNAISLNFWQIIGNILVYNLWKFQIDRLQIKGSISQDLRRVLLYINGKLSLRPIIASHNILKGVSHKI